MARSASTGWRPCASVGSCREAVVAHPHLPRVRRQQALGRHLPGHTCVGTRLPLVRVAECRRHRACPMPLLPQVQGRSHPRPPEPTLPPRLRPAPPCLLGPRRCYGGRREVQLQRFLGAVEAGQGERSSRLLPPGPLLPGLLRLVSPTGTTRGSLGCCSCACGGRSCTGLNVRGLVGGQI